MMTNKHLKNMFITDHSINTKLKLTGRNTHHACKMDEKRQTISTADEAV